jgi:hypothetical protein
VFPVVSSALISKLWVTAPPEKPALGVPLITPAELKETPAGNAPDDMEYVGVFSISVATTVIALIAKSS